MLNWRIVPSPDLNDLLMRQQNCDKRKEKDRLFLGARDFSLLSRSAESARIGRQIYGIATRPGLFSSARC
jgi:hypothetical protein